MIHVYVRKESNYPVSSPLIKSRLKEYFREKGIKSNADVSVSFVGEKKMISLARKYLNENNVVHNVLSFPFNEENNLIASPDNVIHLGDIVICFPEVINEAKKEGRLINNIVIELVEHGALHLLGEHHK